ncbi:hypothetical protein AKJ40_01265 [candidate division MSBL1 archaeon SCGC-AAA259M10]|uniref:Cytochrome C biogenesis protein transmembrane domain-containing protein n=2 Tax=candidate division MSBL1 TaxID=215777 RepID=A0A133V1Z4_9EURY|nr:hypothetical protein AKJ66_00655 [candidate division MSBL1 archaeon SCGC-AAA259E22]KXB00470.1 hypothetical protein AKJ40_01265 [candidate division MSBL1 archaeon SCGC-AAA259M10]
MTNFEIISLAFSAGAASFLNPCSFALLPAYLSFFLGKDEKRPNPENWTQSILKGLKYGLSATLGFAVVFLTIGFLVSLASVQIKPFLTPFTWLIGILLIILGFFWILNKPFLYLSSISGKIELQRTSFFLFGAAYALSSLACVFPVFLMLIFSTIQTGAFISGVSVFIAFTLGMGFLMITVSIAMALSKEYLINQFRKVRKYITRISGGILILAGIYLLVH